MRSSFALLRTGQADSRTGRFFYTGFHNRSFSGSDRRSGESVIRLRSQCGKRLCSMEKERPRNGKPPAQPSSLCRGSDRHIIIQTGRRTAKAGSCLTQYINTRVEPPKHPPGCFDAREHIQLSQPTPRRRPFVVVVNTHRIIPITIPPCGVSTYSAGNPS